MCNCGQTVEEKRWAAVVIVAELLRLAGLGVRVSDTYPLTVWLGVRWIGLPAPVVWFWPVLRRFVCWRLGVGLEHAPERIENSGCGCVFVARRAVDLCRYRVHRFLFGRRTA